MNGKQTIRFKLRNKIKNEQQINKKGTNKII